jgi:hypothetical protein
VTCFLLFSKFHFLFRLVSRIKIQSATLRKAGIAQSVYRLARVWTVRGSNPSGGEILGTSPDRSWGPPSLLYNGYRVFHGGKAAGERRWPPTPSSAEDKERVELYLYSPSGPSWPVLGWTLRLPFTCGSSHFRPVRIAVKTLSFVLSVCPHVSARVPLDGYPWNLILGTFMNACR